MGNKLIAAAWLSFFLAKIAIAETAVEVLAVTATSYGNSSAEAECVLQETCTIAWSPGLIGNNGGEGVRITFTKPQSIGGLELNGTGNFLLSFNDSRAQLFADVKPSTGKFRLYRYDRMAPEKNTGVAPAPQSFLVKSIFIEVAPPQKGEKAELVQIKNISFLAPSKQDKLSLHLPRQLRARGTVSSTLSPESAYSLRNLFDQKEEMAWVSDGKRTNGKGVAFKFELSQKVEITGFTIWNGYQRSQAHFKANAKVKRLTFKTGKMKESFSLADSSGPQQKKFHTIKGPVPDLAITIDEVFQGAKYKDLAISELNFQVKEGGNMHLKVPSPPIALTQIVSPFMNRRVDTFLEEQGGVNRTFVFRDDGTFRIVSAVNDDSGEREIREGNWTVEKNGLRVFGRRYVSKPTYQPYSKSAELSEVDETQIFQFDMKIVEAKDLPAKELEQAIRDHMMATGYDSSFELFFLPVDTELSFAGPVQGSFFKNVAKSLIAKKILLVKSPLFNGFAIAN